MMRTLASFVLRTIRENNNVVSTFLTKSLVYDLSCDLSIELFYEAKQGVCSDPYLMLVVLGQLINLLRLSTEGNYYRHNSRSYSTLSTLYL